MAIVSMKRVSMLAPAEDEGELLALIQRLQCVHLTPSPDDDAGFTTQRAPEELQAVDDQIARVQWAVGKLGRYDQTKKPFLGDKPSITTDEARELTTARRPELMRTVEALEALEREAGELRGQSARISATREQLAPWAGLSVPIPQVRSTRGTVAVMGTAQKLAVEALLAGGELSPLACVEVVSAVRENAYLYAVMHRSVADETLARLKAAGFAPAQPQDVPGTVAQKLEALDADEKRIEARQKEILDEIAAHATDINDLKALYDCLATRRGQLLARQSLVASKSTFFLTGWTPDTLADKLEKRIHRISPSACVEFADPDEGDDPPVALGNGPFVSPYETIVTGFALPDYRGLDPTAVMTPFFINFMGMMVSDAGYGLLMAIAIPILIKLCKPSANMRKLMWVIFGGSVMTVVWGALYNTWFGFGPWPTVFDPINDSLPVMGACVGLGAVHLFAGLGVAAYMNVKRGKPLAAVADQLSWFMLVLGLILMVLPMFVPNVGAGIVTAGQWLAIAGAGIVLVTSGREKSRNPFKRLLSGLGALYGATGWISDLLSYMRLFGMGLATGVIGMVINQLVGMVFSSGIIGIVIGSVLFVGAHMFNLAINVLGAYVHSCRLQYIEFFGKFYEEGGKPFVPLASTSRYCYIKEAPERA